MSTGYYLPTHYPTPELTPERIAELRGMAEREHVLPELTQAKRSQRNAPEPEQKIAIEKYKRRILMSILKTGSHKRHEEDDGGVIVVRATQALLVHKVIDTDGRGSMRPRHTAGANFETADEWFLMRKRCRWQFHIADVIKDEGVWKYEPKHRRLIVKFCNSGHFVKNGNEVVAGERFHEIHARWNVETGEDE